MFFVDETSREGKAASLKATECYVISGPVTALLLVNFVIRVRCELLHFAFGVDHFAPNLT